MGLPNWLRGREGDYDMTHDDEVHVPEIAKVESRVPPLVEGPKKGGINPPPPQDFIRPKPPLPFHIAPRDDDQAAAVVAQAHSYIEQWKIERVAQQKENEQLKSDLKAEQRKTGLLELDIAERDNNIATLQSQIIALKEREEKFRTFLSVKKQICEKEIQTYIQFEIGDPPKKERKANAKKAKVKKESADRQSTDQTVEKPHAV